jgi:hypothetical protein
MVMPSPAELDIAVLYINYRDFKKISNFTLKSKGLDFDFTKKMMFTVNLVENLYFLFMRSIFHLS